jgi:serine/threonine protein kinase
MSDETRQPEEMGQGHGGVEGDGGVGLPETRDVPVQPSQVSVEAERPERVGSYFLQEVLGEGGMGTVFRAEQRHPIKRTVALKLIKAGYGSREAINRFNSERQALARMDHPSIAKVLDAGTSEQGQPYFVMEYVPGVPLPAWADQEGLNIRQRIALFMDVCGAISHAHGKAILHRDIKGNNVLGYMADGKPAAKVIDFGIAKALGDERLADGTLTSATSGPVGTLYAMPPEQVEGSPDIDTRADVYSLGVLLYELLCGRRPFELKGKAYGEILEIVRTKQPPEPSRVLTGLGAVAEGTATDRGVSLASLVRELRRELDWVPLKAMRKERERRYESVAALAEDCRNYLEGRPLEARPEDRLYRIRKFVGRNRVAVGASAVVLVAAVGAGVAGVGMLRARVSEANARETAEGTVAFAEAAFFEGDATNGDGRGARATVTHALIAALAEIQKGRFDRAPEVKARLLTRIGRTLREQEYNVRAGAVFDELLNTYRSYLPEESVQVAETYMDQATCGSTEKAKLLMRAQLILEKLGQTGTMRYAAVLAQRLTVPAIDSAERDKIAGQCLALIPRLDPAKDDVGLIYQQLGYVKAVESDWEAAIGYCAKAVQAKAVFWREGSVAIAGAGNNLASALINSRKTKNVARAVDVLLPDAIRTFREKGIDMSPLAFRAEILRANGLRDLCRWDQAEKAYRMVIERVSVAPRDDQELLAGDLATAHSGLGKTLLEAGRADEAVSELEQAFAWRLANPDRVEEPEKRMPPLAVKLKEAYRATSRPSDAERVDARLFEAFPALRIKAAP